MAFQYLNRAERRAAAKYARQEARKRPAMMTEIPKEQWPPRFRLSAEAPLRAWNSSKYLAQLYGESNAQRLSICRITLNGDGQWEDGLSWEALMQVKRECGFGDYYGVEVYPQDSEIVNVANMRHIWLLPTPLTIGWFRGRQSETREQV